MFKGTVFSTTVQQSIWSETQQVKMYGRFNSCEYGNMLSSSLGIFFASSIFSHIRVNFYIIHASGMCVWYMH